MTNTNYCAVYDFELMPYALGDVLTWNIQTAIRCENLGRERVDVYICMDERYPASIYQKGLVTAENCGLFFNELYGAFGTHPRLGGIFIYRRREEMLQRLSAVSEGDAVNSEVLSDYLRVLDFRGVESALNEYFIKYIYLHEHINDFAHKHGRIPRLLPSQGCDPDVTELIQKRFAGRKIVTVHVRLRRLDVGYGGEHTYTRDSDFLEWYEFLREAGNRYPEAVFVMLGRLQEKPLEMLKLPNVLSLRILGLGLGHELTLMLRSDLFIGSSSGFAAMANFSKIAYFITKMNKESCNAYQIEQGCDRLPFATERQLLIYEPETREMLMRLLERGLAGVSAREGSPVRISDGPIDIRSWSRERSQKLFPGATTHRVFIDSAHSDSETAFLLWPKIEEARVADSEDRKDQAWSLMHRVETNFPTICRRFPEFLRLKAHLAFERKDWRSFRSAGAQIAKLGIKGGFGPVLRELARPWLLPWHNNRLGEQLAYLWQRKHRILPVMIVRLKSLSSGRTKL